MNKEAKQSKQLRCEGISRVSAVAAGTVFIRKQMNVDNELRSCRCKLKTIGVKIQNVFTLIER